MLVENVINTVEHTHATSMNRDQKFLDGILIPCFEEIEGQIFRFKLGTQTDEYLLSMNSGLAEVAKKAGWEEVAIKGSLDVEAKIFNVEKIIINDKLDPTMGNLAS